MKNRKFIATLLNKSERDLKIGFTSTVGDLLHAGHVAMINDAKAHCDYLIVGLLVDPTKDRPNTKQKPIQTIFERYMQLSSLYAVDEVIPFESEVDLENILLTIHPNVRFCGEEYEHLEHTGKDIDWIDIIYNKRRHPFSSSELISRIRRGDLQ